MKYSKELLNERGFSLIEVLTVSTIALIAMYALTTILTNATKAQRGIQAKDMQREYMGELRVLLAENDACVNTFGTANGGGNPRTGFTVNNIRDTANNIVYSVGGVDPSGLIMYQSFVLEGWVENATIPNKGHAYLRVNLEKVGQVLGSRMITQRMPIQLTLDASDNILSCSYFGGQDSLWKQSSVNPANIYYSGGNVGIGLEDATEALEVAGNVLADAYFWTSDANRKDILSFAPGLKMLRQITGYEFTWKGSHRPDLGVIAQDIEKVFPQLVREDSAKVKHVNYVGLIAPIIESTKELDLNQQTLRDRLIELENTVEELKARCEK